MTDAGIGIKPEDTNRFFKPFEQMDGAATRRQGGTALGLALTRSLVDLHGGKIWSESRGDGKGLTFLAILPIP